MNNVIDNDSGIAIPAETQKSIAELNTVAAGLAELKAKYEAMPDVNTAEGYTLAKQERKEIGAVRIGIEKAHKAGKAFYLDGGRNIDAMKNDILKTVSALEDERKIAIKAIDDEKERVEREVAAKEQARIEVIETRIARIKSAPSDAVTLEQVEKAISMLGDLKSSGTYDEFAEFKEIARSEIQTAEESLSEKLKALTEQAETAQRLAEQQAEQERVAAEQKAAQDKIDEQLRQIENAKLEASRQAEQAEREKQLAAQAETDKQEALKLAEVKRVADIEAAKLAEQERLAKEQEAETLRVAAEKAEAEIKAAEAPDKVKLQAWIDSIPELPEAKSAAGKARVKKMAALLAQLKAA